MNRISLLLSLVAVALWVWLGVKVVMGGTLDPMTQLLACAGCASVAGLNAYRMWVMR